MKGRLFVFLFILFVAGAGLFVRQAYRLWYHIEPLQFSPSMPILRAARDIYLFSVVPGGVYDSQELADSIARDPVARQHYQDIQPERLWPSRISEPMLAYVSFRRGDSVYWTDHKVAIAAGEVVLTDGKNMVRARCGNRIAFKRPTPLPKSVTPPDEPPPDIVFETPLPGLVPPTIVAPAPPTVTVAQKTPDVRYSPPPIWCCTSQKYSPPPSPVPEPGSLLLVGTGLTVTAAWLRRKKRR